MTPKRAALVAGGVILLLAGTCALSGVSLLPASWWLGSCLKDWTSPSSYRSRSSPLGQVRFAVGRSQVRICYGRPSARGRAVFGQLVPYDSLWRTGANEPTRLYATGPIRLGDLALPAGRYSIYSIPRAESWTLYLSRSTTHWGNAITPAVRAQEVGRITVPVEPLADPVETLTIHPEVAGDSALVRVDWESTRVTLPFAPSSNTVP